MADVKIEFSEKELREKFEDYVIRQTKLVSLADILKDNSFKADVIDKVGLKVRDPQLVSVQVK